MRFGFFAAVAVLSMPGALIAQDAQTLARFQAVNAAQPAPAAAEIAGEAMTLLKSMVGRKQVKCMPTAVAIDAIAPATATRLVTEGINTREIKNGWTAEAKLKGCPAAPPSRLIVLRMADGKLLVRVINIGETLTTSSQMRDSSAGAAMAAVTAIRKADPVCEGDGLAMGDTKVVSRGADLGPDVYGTRYVGSWREVWRFSACGVEADVPIAFKADGSGGVTSDIRKGETRIVKP